MKKLGRIQFLDGTMLKIIAMVSMVFDHVGDNFFSDAIWMRVIGRIAMPVFAFCVAEGYEHTHDRIKYLRRLLLFGVISEIPFDLVTAGKIAAFGHQNIMFSFSWAILGLMCLDRVLTKADRKWKKTLFTALAVLVFCAGAIMLRLDYSMLSVLLIFTYHLMQDKEVWIRNTAAAAVCALVNNVGIYVFALLGFIPVYFYNGKRGKGIKWLFYVFYPGHLLLIWALRALLR